VFDAQTGLLVAQASRLLPVKAYPDGGREQSLRSLDRSFREVIRELRDLLGERWRRIQGVGLAAQGGSSIIADRATGEALTPMVLWNDGRTGAYSARVAAESVPAYWRKHVLHDGPPEGLGRLRWLKEKYPQLFTRERQSPDWPACRDNIHIGAGEYVYHKLTGEWRQDAGNAIQIGSYNAARKRLDLDPFRFADVPLSFVAPLREGHGMMPLVAQASRLLELPEGIPVAGPYIDQEAAYLSAINVSDRPLQCSLGTAWVGNFVLPDDTRGWATSQLVIPNPAQPGNANLPIGPRVSRQLSGQGRLVVLPLMAGNLTWDWALRNCIDPPGNAEPQLGNDPEKALRKAARIFAKELLPPEGLVVFPWFTQSNPFAGGAYGGGAICGIGAQTDREQLVRAVVAGLCYEFLRVFENLKRTDAVDSIVLGGGASNGRYFREILAALFAPIPVRWRRDGDLAAARGAVYAFSPAAACSKTQRVAPPAKETAAAIERGYSVYCTALRAIYPSPPGGEPFQIPGNAEPHSGGASAAGQLGNATNRTRRTR